MLQSSYDITRLKGGGGRGGTDRPHCKIVFVVRDGHKKQSGEIMKTCVVYLGNSWLKMAGLTIGDRVDFLFDRAKRIGAIARRSDKSGYKISKAGGLRGRIAFTWRDGMPFADGSVEFNSVSVDGDALKFVIPGECFDAQRRLRGVG